MVEALFVVATMDALEGYMSKTMGVLYVAIIVAYHHGNMAADSAATEASNGRGIETSVRGEEILLMKILVAMMTGVFPFAFPTVQPLLASWEDITPIYHHHRH